MKFIYFSHTVRRDTANLLKYINVIIIVHLPLKVNITTKIKTKILDYRRLLCYNWYRIGAYTETVT